MLRRVLSARFVSRRLYGAKLIGKKNRSALRAFRAVLGQVRDCQEMQVHIQTLAVANPFATAFSAHLVKEEKKAAKTIRRAAKGFDAAPLRALAEKRRLRKKLAKPQQMGVSELFKMLADRVEALVPEAIVHHNDEELHRLRIAFKRFRYAVELLNPLLPQAPASLPGDLKALQDALGIAHDWLVIHHRVAAFRPPAQLPGRAEMNEKVLSLLAQTHQHARAHFAREWPQLARIVLSHTPSAQG